MIWMQIIRLLQERNLQGFLAAAAGAATSVRPAAAALPESLKSTLLQNLKTEKSKIETTR
jgi:hypothetical protein